jgi:hypothetical protein
VWVCVRAAVVRPRPSPGSHRHHQLQKASGRIRGIKKFEVIGDLETGLLKSFLKSGLSLSVEEMKENKKKKKKVARWQQ